SLPAFPTLSDPFGPDSQSEGVVFPAARAVPTSQTLADPPRRVLIESIEPIEGDQAAECPIEWNSGVPNSFPLGDLAVV
ncbi:hypothetical protein ABZ330_33195, partial [Streptomyces sp. NPDC006172]|uniref:hypothetical protein n=1 Tax=Streptomyces sp. NPDC006172 TaxID=3154470 RepID=UPI0033F8BB82